MIVFTDNFDGPAPEWKKEGEYTFWKIPETKTLKCLRCGKTWGVEAAEEAYGHACSAQTV